MRGKVFGVKAAIEQIESAKKRKASEYKKAMLCLTALTKETKIIVSPTNGYQGNCKWKVTAFGKIFYDYDLISAIRKVALLGARLYNIEEITKAGTGESV